MGTNTIENVDLLRKTVIAHLVERIEATPAINEPFAHVYLENVFPADIYARLLTCLPAAEMYDHAADRHYGHGQHVRSLYALSKAGLGRLSAAERGLWTAVAAALTDDEIKRALFRKLACDLTFRYGIADSQVTELAGFSRPTLYRETEGFAIPPHPDTRKKVVTMQFYLPEEHNQLDLGTALYRRRLLAWPFGSWHRRFEKVKQFPFQPNSAYAFVVNNKISRKSWHGREQLPSGAGVRNTLLNTFYDSPRDEFRGYAAA